MVTGWGRVYLKSDPSLNFEPRRVSASEKAPTIRACRQHHQRPNQLYAPTKDGFMAHIMGYSGLPRLNNRPHSAS
jgi:hypothetical protein